MKKSCLIHPISVICVPYPIHEFIPCEVYHLHHKQVQGKEKHATLYLYRHQNKPYQLDYCFVSADIAAKIKSVEIGDFDFWIKYSDHVPVMVTIGKKKSGSLLKSGSLSKSEPL